METNTIKSKVPFVFIEYYISIVLLMLSFFSYLKYVGIYQDVSIASESFIILFYMIIIPLLISLGATTMFINNERINLLNEKNGKRIVNIGYVYRIKILLIEISFLILKGVESITHALFYIFKLSKLLLYTPISIFNQRLFNDTVSDARESIEDTIANTKKVLSENSHE